MEPEPSGLLILIQFLCILSYALLSAADSAAQHLSQRARYALDEDDAAKGKVALQTEQLLAQPSGMRVAMLMLALAIAGLAFWSFALPLAITATNSWGWVSSSQGLPLVLFSLLLLVLYTFLIQLLGNVLPRRLAAWKPRTSAKVLFGYACIINGIFKPLSRLLDQLALLILRLFKIDIMLPNDTITEDEIRMLVDVGEEKGTIEEAEREMIENVFEFNNMTAAECMTHRTDVHAIWAEDSREEILAMIARTGLSRFPVYEEDLDHIIGTVSTREYLLNLLSEHPKPLSGILREARFVPETVRTDLLFRDMQHNKYHMAIVVDEYGGTSGLITMEDLLEEIVGNIYDEYDPQDQAEFEVLAKDRWRVAGTLDVETFNEHSGQDLPYSPDYDTIGGLILSELAAIPEDGTEPEVIIQGLQFKVKSMQGKRIEWVEVSLIDGV